MILSASMAADPSVNITSILAVAGSTKSESNQVHQIEQTVGENENWLKDEIKKRQHLLKKSKSSRDYHYVLKLELLRQICVLEHFQEKSLAEKKYKGLNVGTVTQFQIIVISCRFVLLSATTIELPLMKKLLNH